MTEFLKAHRDDEPNCFVPVDRIRSIRAVVAEHRVPTGVWAMSACVVVDTDGDAQLPAPQPRLDDDDDPIGGLIIWQGPGVGPRATDLELAAMSEADRRHLWSETRDDLQQIADRRAHEIAERLSGERGVVSFDEARR